MNNNEYSSSEYKTKFISELLSMFRIFILVCLVIAPGPTLVCMFVYVIGKKILGKKRAKFYLFLVASVLLAVAFIISISNKTMLSDLISNYTRLLGFVESTFYHFLNVLNEGLGIELRPVDFQVSYLVRWALGDNFTSFSLYFFITSILLYFYRSSDEYMYQDAQRRADTKYDKKKGRIDITQKGHVFCIGTTGSGKTANIMHYIKEAFEKEHFVAIVEGKGDMKEYSIYDYVTKLCKKHGRRLYIINQSNIGETTPYNPFKNATATQIKDMLCLSLSACSSPKKFNAKYENGDGTSQLEFYKDGTVEAYENKTLVSGTYEWTGRNTYEVRMTLWFIQMRYTAVIDGDTLILTDSSDETRYTVYYLVGRNTEATSVPEQRPWNVDDEELK